MQQKLRVGVVFGGRSGEHEVSLRSAQSVIDALDLNKYSIVPILITKEGSWFTPAESLSNAKIKVDEIIRSPADVVAVVGDVHRYGFVRLGKLNEEVEPLDVVFPVLHGTYGEDGTIQGLFEMANIPYVGGNVLASSCGMDKLVMKSLFHKAGLPQCKYTEVLRVEWEQNQEQVLSRVVDEIGFPCFVKPANLGSSVGISKATDRKSLVEAINLAANYDRRLIVEQGLNVRELECAVLGNDTPEASLPGEYVVHDKQAAFLDYTEKYSNTGHVEFVVPAPLPKDLVHRIQHLAVTAFRAVDGAGLARVDFFLRRDTGELLVNELNTMPGFTATSGYPKMWAASGLSFSEVVERLITLALERHQDKLRNKTSI